MQKLNICENCEVSHTGEYGSGRFCSIKCSKGFSTKAKRKEINEKVSKTLILKLNNKLTIEEVNEDKRKKQENKNLLKHASYERETEATTLCDLSTRTISKILKRLKIACSNCNWYVENVVGDLHHIVERKNGGSDDHNNLCYICPNCHRLIHSNKIDINTLISLDKQIGDTWKEYYYVVNKKIKNKKDR